MADPEGSPFPLIVSGSATTTTLVRSNCAPLATTVPPAVLPSALPLASARRPSLMAVVPV